jgi:glucosamine--fructose-6-phosphate aminotransferase (isomerizing)
VLQLLTLLASEARNTLPAEARSQRLRELQDVPNLVQAQLAAWHKTTEAMAAMVRDASSFLFLGRDLHYPIAREGALKLKESAYVHAEGYPAGELKHGPNALVSEGTPLVMIATVDQGDSNSVVRYDKVLQLMRDMKTQGATILAVCNQGDREVLQLASAAVEVQPATEPLLALCEVIPLQMLAYFLATARGIDVDRPRNLVKAVVTE